MFMMIWGIESSCQTGKHAWGFDSQRSTHEKILYIHTDIWICM